MDIWNFVFDWHVHCVYFGFETAHIYIVYIYDIQYIEYEPKLKVIKFWKRFFIIILFIYFIDNVWFIKNKK